MSVGTEPGATDVHAHRFELKSFELVDGARWEVTGRWSGVRGRRFFRPELTVDDGTGPQRILADLAHKPWAAEEGTDWLAVFPAGTDAAEAKAAEITVAPDITVPLKKRRGGRRRAPVKQAAPEEPSLPAITQADLDQAHRQTDRLRREAEQLRTQAEASRRAVEQVRAETEQARQDADAHRDELRQLQLTFDATQRDRDHAHAEIARLQAAHAEALRRRDAIIANHEVGEARDSIVADDLRRALDERTELIAERDAAQAAREAALAAGRRAAQARDEAIEARGRLTAERDAALAARDKTAGQHAKELTRREAQARKELDRSVAEVGRLRAELDRARAAPTAATPNPPAPPTPVAQQQAAIPILPLPAGVKRRRMPGPRSARTRIAVLACLAAGVLALFLIASPVLFPSPAPPARTSTTQTQGAKTQTAPAAASATTTSP